MRNVRLNKKLAFRLGVAAGILGGLVFFRLLNLGDYLSLDYIRASEERFRILYEENRILVIAAYMFVYVISTSLSLPGATVLTLAGGALFGFWAGVLIVSFASTLGATLACIVSRFLLRDWVQGKFGDRLRAVNEGLAREGAFYLFTMRLIALFPFWVINMVMGVTKIPLWTFYWVSQVGMLPGTALYVNAGKELAKIDSVSGILSPSLIISFAILGLFPLGVKKLISIYRARAPRPL
ncbi:MAG: TVP38/TMEM64 family protein [bacterium]